MSNGELGAITMPKWGLTMEDGELMEWTVSVGDTIALGQEVANVETDKITGVVESPVAGTVQRLVAQPGDVLTVGSLLAVVSMEPVDDAAIDAFIASYVTSE